MSVVSSTNATGAGSLYQAIIDSNSDGTDITFGSTSGTCTLTSDFPAITNDYDIIGNDLFTVDCGSVNSNPLLNFSNGSGTVSDLTFDMNDDTVGYFVSVVKGEVVTFDGCPFLNNDNGPTSPWFILQSGGDLTFTGCVVTDVHFTGGHMQSGSVNGTTDLSTLTITGCTLTRVGPINTMLRCDLTVTNNTWDNTAMGTPSDAGAVKLVNSTDWAGVVTTITDNTFTSVDSTAGVVKVQGFAGNVTIEDNEFDSCTSSGGTTHPSCVWLDADEGDLSIQRNYVHDCDSTAGWVGCMFLKSDTVNTPDSWLIKDNCFESNDGGLDGGCLSLSTLKLTSGNVKVVNNTFYQNTSERWGGVVRQDTGAGNASVDYAFNTFYGNSCATASSGGAIRVEHENANLYGNILWGNQANSVDNDLDDAGGTFTGNNNLIKAQGDAGLTDGVDGNRIGATYTPGVSALADNGGVVKTCAISTSSDAYDAGSNADAQTFVVTEDARGAGFLRVSGGTVDMGAYEYQHADDITDGLIAYWKFDETSGTNASDSSGNGNDGTLQNGQTFADDSVAGVINKALHFPASVSDEFVRCPDMDDMDGAYQLTIAFWMKQDALAQFKKLFDKRGSSTNINLLYTSSGAGNDLVWNLGDGTDSVTAQSTSYWLAADEWNHVILRLDAIPSADADRVKMYVNGSEETLSFSGTVPDTTGVNSDNFDIGYYNGNFPFNGTFDDFRVYARALTDNEIAELYAYREGGDSPGNFALFF